MWRSTLPKGILGGPHSQELTCHHGDTRKSSLPDVPPPEKDVNILGDLWSILLANYSAARDRRHLQPVLHFQFCPLPTFNDTIRRELVSSLFNLLMSSGTSRKPMLFHTLAMLRFSAVREFFFKYIYVWRIRNHTGETSITPSAECVFVGLGDRLQHCSFCDLCSLVISWIG